MGAVYFAFAARLRIGRLDSVASFQIGLGTVYSADVFRIGKSAMYSATFFAESGYYESESGLACRRKQQFFGTARGKQSLGIKKCNVRLTIY